LTVSPAFQFLPLLPRAFMSERFFVAEPVTGERAELTGDEARHLAAVMRAHVGDLVTLFDGSGYEFTGRIQSIGKRAIELAIVERRQVDRELLFTLTLAVALPKGERQKWLVEKATELGVTRLVPLVTQRGVAQPVESALDRLRRSVIEASKQCGRNRLMEIAAPIAADDLFRAPPQDASRELLCLIADPSGGALPEIGQGNADVLAAIGPEGGFTPMELAAAEAAGWQSVSLGPRTLRVETAAIAVASWAALK
jgi:16S rRNA (uracil1498-N3)-methyltransferase